MPEDLLAFTLCVDVRRIEEVDTGVDGRFDQLIGPGRANGADGLPNPSAISERHRAKADGGELETGVAECFVVHDVFLPCG